MYTHCVANCALPVCSVINVSLGQLTAILLENIVSIGYKQGISLDPLMWPIPRVTWQELLEAIRFMFHYDFCDFLELWGEGEKSGELNRG